MNKDETLALHARGQEAWNEWAEGMLADRDGLKATSEWEKWEREWSERALADFADHEFTKAAFFRGFIFPGTANFANAKFHKDAQFEGATFHDDATFGRARFCGDAWFQGAIFGESAWFWGAKFSRYAGFLGTTFRRRAVFRKARFKGEALFSEASFGDEETFVGRADFTDAMFGGRTKFTDATFIDDACFAAAMFSGRALFERATFSGDAVFGGATFDGPTLFANAQFTQAAVLAGIKANRAFSLAKVEFQKVPDFTQAHFAEAPLLDDIKISLNECEASVRYRALKRLAIQGHDHVHELDFFAAELKALGGVKWLLVFLYELFSDFGRSMARPLYCWLLWLGYFTLFYVAQAIDRFSCKDGSETMPLWAAFLLSFHRALPPTGLGNEVKLKEIYACLYGNGDRIPDAVALLGVGQSVISLVLIFLLLLAIRNHFRIR